MNNIAILLSSYNGNDYIEEQIESIYKQNYSDFQLYIRDDGSEKKFVDKLKQLQNKYPFVLMEGENIGFVKSFMTLLEQVDDAKFYAFADQDDIWLPNKLQTAMNWFEENGNTEIPQLFHSAYDVIDSESRAVTGHFYFSNKQYDFRRSITENHYSGFSMMINQDLRKKMLQGDADRIGYHDWWAAMIVHAFGEGYSDDKVTALHRAHGDNVTTFNMSRRLQWLRDSLLEESDIRKRALEFERCFGNLLSNTDRKDLNMFSKTGYHLGYALKKSFYPKRWRPILSSEIIMRVLMMIGKV